jgi:hypothetical protein
MIFEFLIRFGFQFQEIRTFMIKIHKILLIIFDFFK